MVTSASPRAHVGTDILFSEPRRAGRARPDYAPGRYTAFRAVGFPAGDLGLPPFSAQGRARHSVRSASTLRLGSSSYRQITGYLFWCPDTLGNRSPNPAGRYGMYRRSSWLMWIRSFSICTIGQNSPSGSVVCPSRPDRVDVRAARIPRSRRTARARPRDASARRPGTRTVGGAVV